MNGGSRETASRLGISVRTLESHMGNIFEKLSVASRHELAALAYEEGYVEGARRHQFAAGGTNR